MKFHNHLVSIVVYMMSLSLSLALFSVATCESYVGDPPSKPTKMLDGPYIYTDSEVSMTDRLSASLLLLRAWQSRWRSQEVKVANGMSLLGSANIYMPLSSGIT